MPQTLTATKIGTFKSVLRAAGVSNAGATSLDVLTVAHNLGACPNIVDAVLRSVVATYSGGPPNLALRSWNASQAIFDFPLGIGDAGDGTSAAQFDIICELSHSLVQ